MNFASGSTEVAIEVSAEWFTSYSIALIGEAFSNFGFTRHREKTAWRKDPLGFPMDTKSSKYTESLLNVYKLL